MSKFQLAFLEHVVPSGAMFKQYWCGRTESNAVIAVVDSASMHVCTYVLSTFVDAYARDLLYRKLVPQRKTVRTKVKMPPEGPKVLRTPHVAQNTPKLKNVAVFLRHQISSKERVAVAAWVAEVRRQ